ncbi:hypothetical protein VQL36_14430 [Chengkuizengella sp. SCS-71B]|uniref:hypothetical protein n=1 Tax=Chengkuizengella sp. SCS-71B TaxID=3115290 RepID=UPI0032C23EDD
MASKKGFSSLAAIVLVLFILLVIIIVAARGRSRYGSGDTIGTIDIRDEEQLLALQEQQALIQTQFDLIVRIEQTQRALLQQLMQTF